jgi:DNA-binding response OmpR family regulator
MPDTDGYEGCRKIKSLKSSIGHLAVVMLTSKASPFDRIRGKMAGCDAYLTKPVEPARLYEVLAHHIGIVEPAKAAADPGQRPQPDSSPQRAVIAQRA